MLNKHKRLGKSMVTLITILLISSVQAQDGSDMLYVRTHKIDSSYIGDYVYIDYADQGTAVHAIYFQKNSYQLGKKENIILDQVSKECNSPGFSFLKIFAYADTMGSINHNDLLSRKRAHAVYNYISAHAKIDSTRIYVTWLGESTDGGYDLHFPEAHLQQRCVDILVQYKGK